MQVEFDKETFKSKARQQHQSLKARGVTVKLSDVQESMAVMLGFRNLAHLYAAFADEKDAFAPLSEIAQWVRWVLYLDYDDDRWGVYPEGTTLDDVAARDWTKARTVYDSRKRLPLDLVLNPRATVLETFVDAPSLEAYGLPRAADTSKVNAWVREQLGFRVVESGVETSVRDRGDDSIDDYAILVALTPEDTARLREYLAGTN